MSHQKHISHHSTPAALRLAKLWVSLTALAVAAAGLAAMAASQPATAQISPLDPALCATTYKPAANAGTRTEADCRTIVAWRNAVVSHPDSVIGATHNMALWGTGAQTKFNTWSQIETTLVSGVLVVTKIELNKRRMAGPLPGRLPNITHLILDENFFAVEFPTWLYTARELRFLDLRSNRLRGTINGPAFNTPKLVNLLLQHNRFSGPVPDFNFTRLPKLTDLRLASNGFSGDIPTGWSLAADGRGWQRLQLAGNYITGDLPAWVSNLKFANSFSPWQVAVGPGRDYYISFSYNRLCIPSGFTLPRYKKLNGQDANVQAYFGNNQCPGGQPSSAVSKSVVKKVQFQTVDASGDQTSENPVGLKVTWQRPSGVDATIPLLYAVVLHPIVPIHDNRGLCLSEYFNIPNVGPNTLATNEITVTASHCEISGPSFDPTKYTVSVVTATVNGRSVTPGPSAISSVWSVYIMDDAQKTYRDVANVMGLDYNRNIWRWDAVNQMWQLRNQLQQDFASLSLEPGSALAIRTRVLTSWLPLAGLSTADADTPVELQNGWNVLSAGGDVTRGDDENGAFFIDDTLIDCSSNQGAIAILRNVPGTQRFDIELPCHSSREAALIRGQSFSAITEIEELDTLFVYFRSVLPVTISWDDANDRYASAN